MRYVILVCGSRDWNDRAALANGIGCGSRAFLRTTFELVHGGAQGADALAGQIATEMSIATHIRPAQWEKYGPSAGPRRNQAMLDEFLPRLAGCVAFLLADRPCRGTRDMMDRAIKACVPVLVITAERPLVAS